MEEANEMFATLKKEEIRIDGLIEEMKALEIKSAEQNVKEK